MKELICLVAIAFSAVPAFGALTFEGAFDEPQVSSAQCENLLDGQTFTVRHFLTGPTYRTSVLNFQLKPTDPPGKAFLQNITVTGLFGYDNDFNDDRTFVRGDKEFYVAAEGIISNELLVADVTVTMRDAATHEPLCTAKAEISAFH